MASTSTPVEGARVEGATAIPSTSQNLETVEMDNLDSNKAGGRQGLAEIPHTSPINLDFPSGTGPSRTTENTKPATLGGTTAGNSSGEERTLPQKEEATSTSILESGLQQTAPPAIVTTSDSAAIGAATDIPPTPVVASESGPVLVITLLLPTGARHPYKIDEKYLTKRNVTVPGVTESGRKDPFTISVYTLKELILREWREEWEAAPSSPSSIRLIFFGRLLDDKTALKDCKFNAETANVVHMTVRPQDIVDEEEASKNQPNARGRDGEENTAGCRCVIL